MSKWHKTEFCENCYKEWCCSSECKYHLLHRIKEAREDIKNEIKFWSEPPKAKLLPSAKALRDGKANSYKHCLEILDKLISESED